MASDPLFAVSAVHQNLQVWLACGQLQVWGVFRRLPPAPKVSVCYWVMLNLLWTVKPFPWEGSIVLWDYYKIYILPYKRMCFLAKSALCTTSASAAAAVWGILQILLLLTDWSRCLQCRICLSHISRNTEICASSTTTIGGFLCFCSKDKHSYCWNWCWLLSLTLEGSPTMPHVSLVEPLSLMTGMFFRCLGSC